MKNIVNSILVGAISYCISLWIFIGGCYILNKDAKFLIPYGVVSSLVIAFLAGFYVWEKMRDAKLIIDCEERSLLFKSVNNKLVDLGFVAALSKQKKLKYKSSVWFSLLDPKVNIRVKNRKAIIKGRRQDIEVLMDQLSKA